MNSHRAFKANLYEQFASIGKALASPARLELLDLVGQTERSVEDLALEDGPSVANASQHLQVLRQARLVEVRREGKFSNYRLAGKEAFKTWQPIRDLAAAKVAEVRRLAERYLDTCDELARSPQHHGAASAARYRRCGSYRRSSGIGISGGAHSMRVIRADGQACNRPANAVA